MALSSARQATCNLPLTHPFPNHRGIATHLSSPDTLSRTWRLVLPSTSLPATAPLDGRAACAPAAYASRRCSDLRYRKPAHFQPLTNSATTSTNRGAMAAGGNTSRTAPSWMAARGMPNIAQLASSCAMVYARRRWSDRMPYAPSRPMPVNSTPTARDPHTSATACIVTSIDGR